LPPSKLVFPGKDPSSRELVHHSWIEKQKRGQSENECFGWNVTFLQKKNEANLENMEWFGWNVAIWLICTSFDFVAKGDKQRQTADATQPHTLHGNHLRRATDPCPPAEMPKEAARASANFLRALQKVRRAKILDLCRSLRLYIS
jgi:hypothetical protein